MPLTTCPCLKHLCGACVPDFGWAILTWAVTVPSGGIFFFSLSIEEAYGNYTLSLGNLFNCVEREGINGEQDIFIDQILYFQKTGCVQIQFLDF